MTIQRVTWHTAMLEGPVWATQRGQWKEAVIVGRGRKTCRVKFVDNGKCAIRRYDELAGRAIAKKGLDRPEGKQTA